MSATTAKPGPPFLPFTRAPSEEARMAGVAEVLRSGWLTSGPQVKEFELQVSKQCGGRPVRAFNSGTCTMEIALRIAGVGPGEEVPPRPTALSSGLKEFELEVAKQCGGRPVRAFNSGTCTMEIALRIAGVGPGDEVITTPLSWVATSNVILEVGARPVFVDIDRATRTIDLDRVGAAVTPRTRAILPVDLAGLPVGPHALHANDRPDQPH